MLDRISEWFHKLNKFKLVIVIKHISISVVLNITWPQFIFIANNNPTLMYGRHSCVAWWFLEDSRIF